MRSITLSVIFFVVCTALSGDVLCSGDYGWYSEGGYTPGTRIKVTLENTLDFDRIDCPVIISRSRMPIVNYGERDITVVDPALPSQPEPSEKEIERVGGHITLGEKNGHYILYQLDDIDKDGLWDELFFMTDIRAREIKTIYIYIGFNNRGLYELETHAGIGNYGRHLVPWWESKVMGWKLWFPTNVDLYAKREPMLVAYEEYTLNLSGYHVPYEHGSDIMTVSTTFGAGGICLFEHSASPDSVSRPRFSPYRPQGELNKRAQFNNPVHDTRYAFDVVVNGPLRSIIRAHTMNWRTGKGQYELEQFYTAYKNKSYSTCIVRYLKFMPENSSTAFGCAIRKIMEEDEFFQKDGIIISVTKDFTILDANLDTVDRERLVVDYEGIALVVKDKYRPEYQYIKGFGGNHVFRMPVTENLTYEYLIAGAWSEGTVNKTAEKFRQYIFKTAEKYNNPLIIKELKIEKK